MSSNALDRFLKSMEIGYEQWHDGIGYDLEAIDHLNESEKKVAEGRLVPRAANDWRDLEALDRLGTPRATQAIINTRKDSNPEIRLRAHQYGPAPTEAEWVNSIVSSLETAELFSGLTNALTCAMEHPSQMVIDTLWSKVRDPASGVAYHCAAALCCIAGQLDSMYDDKYRSLFLRLVGPQSEVRELAVKELEGKLGLR